MIEPIKPSEVVSLKSKILPDYVIEAINESIAENFLNGRAKIEQTAIINKIMTKAAAQDIGLSRNQIFANHYLDFEDIYRAQGWSVHYDKPGYNESYEANFVFKEK